MKRYKLMWPFMELAKCFVFINEPNCNHCHVEGSAFNLGEMVNAKGIWQPLLTNYFDYDWFSFFLFLLNQNCFLWLSLDSSTCWSLFSFYQSWLDRFRCWQTVHKIKCVLLFEWSNFKISPQKWLTLLVVFFLKHFLVLLLLLNE